MAIDQHFLDEIERKLATHSPTLAGEYRLAVAELQPVLSESDFRLWAEEGVGLAGHSLRSWEAAVDYFRASPGVLRAMPSAAFRRWAHAGRDLAEYSSVVAAAPARSITYAAGTSPRRASGTPITCAVATAGCDSSTSSTSGPAIL